MTRALRRARRLPYAVLSGSVRAFVPSVTLSRSCSGLRDLLVWLLLLVRKSLRCREHSTAEYRGRRNHVKAKGH